MKLTILQNILKKGLTISERIISKSTTFPILSCALLKAEKNFFSLTTTDLERALIWKSLAKVEKEGTFCVPFNIFRNSIETLPEKPIIIFKENNTLYIQVNEYKISLKGQNFEEFPIIPKITEEVTVNISAKDFCQALTQIVSFTSFSSTKIEISGIFLSFQKNLVKMVATDSFRLGEKKLFINFPKLEKEYFFILPQKTAREIINIFSEEEGDIKIFLSPEQILFEKQMEEIQYPKIQFLSRLIEGEFPDYETVIPKKYETQIFLKKNDFINHIKAASFFSGKNNAIKIKTDSQNNQVEISSQTPDIGSYSSILPAKIKGKDREVFFNHRFLIEGLINIKTTDVFFELNKRTGNEQEAGPAVIKPTEGEDYLYVVMPIEI